MAAGFAAEGVLRGSLRCSMAASRPFRSLATMSETATMRAAVYARPGGHAAGVRVGDYVGEGAAEAARAVRRAGLRPGLDRSFGCAAELTGLVVAQEPASGEQLARNGMVTLYVAAPGTDAEPHAESHDHQRLGAEETAEHASPAPAAAVASAAGPRRRKPGRARGAEQRTLEVAPESTSRTRYGETYETPGPADTQTAERNDDPQPGLQPRWAADGAKTPEGARHEPSYETLLAEEVFAGRSGEGSLRSRPPARRARSWRGALGWVRRRPVLAASVSAMLVLWLVVAFAGTPAGPRANGLASTTPRAPGAPHTTIFTRQPAREHPAAQRRRAAEGIVADTQTTKGHRERRTPGWIGPTAQAGTLTDVTRQGQAASIPVVPAQSSAAPDPTPAQSAGGPFSP